MDVFIALKNCSRVYCIAPFLDNTQFAICPLTVGSIQVWCIAGTLFGEVSEAAGGSGVKASSESCESSDDGYI